MFHTEDVIKAHFTCSAENLESDSQYVYASFPPLTSAALFLIYTSANEGRTTVLEQRWLLDCFGGAVAFWGMFHLLSQGETVNGTVPPPDYIGT